MTRTKLHPLFHKSLDLDVLAKKYGTDKSTLGHGYTLHYENWFKDLRNEPIKLLEWGINTGASLKMWGEYFTSGQIYGVDRVKMWDSSAEGARAHLTLGNLDDLGWVESYLGQIGSLDIIIDDAAHTLDQQRALFDLGFGCLKTGGIYVIEDLHTSYWEDWGGPKGIVEYLKDKVDCVNYPARKVNALDGEYKYCGDAYANGPVSMWDTSIYSVSFYRSMCFIVKTP